MAFCFLEKIKLLFWTLSPVETNIMIKKALYLGINFFDKANISEEDSSENFIWNLFKKG